MKPWADRAREEANLLNPPFCCTVITSACAGYQEESGELLPLVLAFMVMPIVLHKTTREALPRTSRTSLPAWLQERAYIKIGFHERLMTLKPYTREAIRYGMAFGWIVAAGTGGLQCDVPNQRIIRARALLDGDAYDCISRARFVGRWFGTAASTETTMALWGIRP